MAWLEDYDPTPPQTYELQLEPGPPSLAKALVVLAGFLVGAAAIWWMATVVNTSLPRPEPATAVARASPPRPAPEVLAPVPPPVAKGLEEVPSYQEMPLPQRPESPAAKEVISEAEQAFLRASQLYDEGRYAEAAEALRKGLALEPESSLQRAMLAMVLSYQEKWEESAEEYRKAIALDKENALLHLGLATALHRLEKIEQAKESLKRALALDPSLQEAKSLLALLSRKPEGKLERVWFEHNVRVKGWEGFWIHSALTVKFWDGKEGILRALFFRDDGSPVYGTFSNMVLSDGQAAIEGVFRPPHRLSRYKDLHLFFPYRGLRLQEGEHRLRVKLELIDSQGRILDSLWASLNLEVLKTAYEGSIEEARSSTP